MWIDGTHMEDGSGYSNWACGEPNNFIGTEDCVEIDRGLIPSQRWKAIPCEGTFFSRTCVRKYQVIMMLPEYVGINSITNPILI